MLRYYVIKVKLDDDKIPEDYSGEEYISQEMGWTEQSGIYTTSVSEITATPDPNMKRIAFTAYCQCCYHTGLDVPEELLKEGREHDLTEYVNDHIDECIPVDGYEFLEDLPIEDDDLISNYELIENDS